MSDIDEFALFYEVGSGYKRMIYKNCFFYKLSETKNAKYWSCVLSRSQAYKCPGSAKSNLNDQEIRVISSHNHDRLAYSL